MLKRDLFNVENEDENAVSLENPYLTYNIGNWRGKVFAFCILVRHRNIILKIDLR
jgi:hypothetical protein